jgi:hypothetical protein
MSRGVRRTIVVLTALAALTAAATALSAGDEGAPFNGSSAFGGGRFGPGCFPGGTFCIALHRDLAFDVHQRGEGLVRGSISYGRNGAGTGGIEGDVNCLSIDGNRAAIGGITANGEGFVIYVTDNGPVGGSTLDEASLMLVDPLEAPGAWPEGFPRVCPSPDDNPIGTIPLHSGNLTVGES